MNEIISWLVNNTATTIFSLVLGSILTTIYQNRKYINIFFKTLVHRNQEYRISYAYLFRIKVDNEYLLIKGNRIDQYQPVGGVYKYYDSFKDKLEKWEIKNEKNRDFYDSNDLRIFIKGKYIISFFKWIESSFNREIDCKREFIEELIEPGYLNIEELKTIQFEYLKRINSGIHYSPHFKCNEILIFDIYDVLNLSSDAIEKLKKINNNKLLFVTADEIEKQCVQLDGISKKIGAHSIYIE